MAEHEQCAVKVERVGDVVIVDIPDGKGQHYELTLSATFAIRLGTALIRKGTDPRGDSLADDLLEKAIATFEEEGKK